MKNSLNILMTLALFLSAAGPARAATLEEIFLLLPAIECGGYDAAQRQALLAKISTDAPSEMEPVGRPGVPSPLLRKTSENFMVLHRPQGGDITYKLFEGSSFQLLAICRGRQRPVPGDPIEFLDIGLYRFDRLGLRRVSHYDYLPDIGILDFVTADTVTDRNAVHTLARLAPTYTECLSCSLSETHRLTMDIITATAMNAAPCNDLLPTFGRLPLTWNGQIFTKPYDRAAPRAPDRDIRRPDAEKNQTP